MNLKRFFLFNFVLIILVLLITELFFYQTYRNKYYNLIELQLRNNKDFSKLNVKDHLPSYKKSILYNYKEHRDKEKFVEIGKSDKLPIITIGCSYAYGIFLDKKDTLAGQLNKVTGRTVYNLGLSGTGPQLVYEQLADPAIKKEIPEAEYVIYVFLHNHIMRQFMGIITPNLGYVNIRYYIDKKGNLKKKKQLPLFINSSFAYRTYLEKQMNEKNQQEIQKGIPLFLKTMEESVKVMKKNYPNAKFVLIEFPQAYMCTPGYVDKTTELTEKNIKDIQKLGIIYINAEQLVGHKYRDVKKYRIADQDHPNEIVWKEMAPALKNKLNL